MDLKKCEQSGIEKCERKQGVREKVREGAVDLESVNKVGLKNVNASKEEERRYAKERGTWKSVSWV